MLILRKFFELINLHKIDFFVSLKKQTKYYSLIGI